MLDLFIFLYIMMMSGLNAFLLHKQCMEHIGHEFNSLSESTIFQCEHEASAVTSLSINIH